MYMGKLKIGKSGYLKALTEGKKQALHGYVRFYGILVYGSCSIDASLTRICLSSHSFRFPSAGYFPDYQCTG